MACKDVADAGPGYCKLIAPGYNLLLGPFERMQRKSIQRVAPQPGERLLALAGPE